MWHIFIAFYSSVLNWINFSFWWRWYMWYVLAVHSMWSWEAIECTYVYKYRAILLKIVSFDSDSCLAIGCPVDRSHIFQWNIIHLISNLIKNSTLNVSANKHEQMPPCVKVFLFSLIYFWLRNNHKLYNFKINMIILLSPMRNNYDRIFEDVKQLFIMIHTANRSLFAEIQLTYCDCFSNQLTSSFSFLCFLSLSGEITQMWDSFCSKYYERYILYEIVV